MSLTFSEGSAVLTQILKKHLGGMIQTVAQEDILELTVIGDKATRYGILAAQGSEEAARNLKHLESQLLGFAIRKGFREQRRFVESLMIGLTFGSEAVGILVNENLADAADEVEDTPEE